MIYFKKENRRVGVNLKITRENVLKIVGKKIKEARIERGYSQEKASELIEISIDQLRNIENRRSIGSFEVILNICNSLKISPNELFYELLDEKEEVLNRKLYSDFEKLSLKDKEMIKMLMSYLNKEK